MGSVIVHNNIIIGEGWHYQAGQPHAEVNAINSVKDKELLKEVPLIDNGFVSPLKGNGLGIELKDKWLDKANSVIIESNLFII